MRTFIITEGGNKIGFGHITRCLSIAQAFQEKAVVPEFVINGDKTIERLLRNKKYRILNWLKKQGGLFNLINGADIVITDSYLATQAFYDKISRIVKLPVYLDDNGIIRYQRGVVVSGIARPKKSDNYHGKSVICLVGARYIPLRKIFWKVAKKAINERVETIMLTFGGNDSKNLTEKILAFLNEDYPRLKKRVIIGKGFRHVDQIVQMRGPRTNLIFWPEPDRLKRAMLESDVAVSVGGQTLCELACVGVPSIAIAVAENQLNNIDWLRRKGFAEYAGWWADRNIADSVKNKLIKLQPRHVRVKKYSKGREIIDGFGSRRIVERVLDYYERYQDRQ